MFARSLALDCAALLTLVHTDGPLSLDTLRGHSPFVEIGLTDGFLDGLVAAGLLERHPDRRVSRTSLHRPDVYPAGDRSLWLDRPTLDARVAARTRPPKDNGRVALLVRRVVGGARECPDQVTLSMIRGLPGDAWERRSPDKPEAQLTVMDRSMAEALANGQPIHLFGDNLFVDLDLSARNLPVGTRLRVGHAEVVVSPKAHNGCSKLMARFGKDALAVVSDRATRGENRRGIYWRVVKDGEVAVGDRIVVLERPQADVEA